jgi:transcriptional regulator with XRE-family HTH domain
MSDDRRLTDSHSRLMSTSHRYEPGTPLARQQFAQRLRELRIPRGFRTARSLARALDIDENRYTRYERAEVEPDLTMIRRICETLGVTPDALLGFDTLEDPTAPPPITGKAFTNGMAATPLPSRATDLQTSAWLLAEAATSLLRTNASHAAAPLTPVAETCKTYKALVERPFETISKILAHADLSNVDLPSASALRDSIDQFVANIKSRT